MHMYWRSYEQVRGFQKTNVGGSSYPDGRQYNTTGTEYNELEHTKKQVINGTNLMNLQN